jgi:ADP-heptose:LPS heptosyltransferase
MASRFPSRLLIATIALGRLAAGAPLRLLRGRRAPVLPGRVLVLHQLLLGDTLMLSALLARLREKYPRADIVMTCSPAQMPLYAARPWGVRTLASDERNVATLWRLFKSGPYDLVLVPAENRLTWLAAALGAKWIAAFAGDRPAYKNWLVDDMHPFSPTPVSWGDMAAQLADAQALRPFRRSDWPAPVQLPFAAPPTPYTVLHVGASSRLRHWSAERWREVAAHLQSKGFAVAITCGAGEAALISAIDPERRFHHYAGNLDLPQLWHLLRGARLAVSLDTGIAHLARTAGAPVVVLFGPGSAQLFGGGEFFSAIPERKVFIPDFFCRDENMIFRRHVIWAKHCGRTTDKCQNPKCMHAIETGAVLSAIEEILQLPAADK